VDYSVDGKRELGAMKVSQLRTQLYNDFPEHCNTTSLFANRFEPALSAEEGQPCLIDINLVGAESRMRREWVRTAAEWLGVAETPQHITFIFHPEAGGVIGSQCQALLNAKQEDSLFNKVRLAREAGVGRYVLIHFIDMQCTLYEAQAVLKQQLMPHFSLTNADNGQMVCLLADTVLIVILDSSLVMDFRTPLDGMTSLQKRVWQEMGDMQLLRPKDPTELFVIGAPDTIYHRDYLRGLHITTSDVPVHLTGEPASWFIDSLLEMAGPNASLQTLGQLYCTEMQLLQEAFTAFIGRFQPLKKTTTLTHDSRRMTITAHSVPCGERATPNQLRDSMIEHLPELPYSLECWPYNTSRFYQTLWLRVPLRFIRVVHHLPSVWRPFLYILQPPQPALSMASVKDGPPDYEHDCEWRRRHTALAKQLLPEGGGHPTSPSSDEQTPVEMEVICRPKKTKKTVYCRASELESECGVRLCQVCERHKPLPQFGKEGQMRKDCFACNKQRYNERKRNKRS
jgi:hypothetical protein